MSFLLGKRVKIVFLAGAAASLILLFGGCSEGGISNGTGQEIGNNHEHGDENNQEHEDPDVPEAITLMHIHGLGYSAHGKRILIPSHHGLTVYSGGKWIAPRGELYDYMGFAAVDDGFYSSGHPPEGSTLANPLGLVVSRDEGKKIDFLNLYGEADFHGLAAGYETHAIYVINTTANSRMKTKGLFYTLDQAQTWSKSDMAGLTIAPFALAAHPTQEAVLAVGSQQGTFLSNDYGHHFAALLKDIQTTALFYQYDGDLLVGGIKNEVPVLLRLHVESQQMDEFKIPVPDKDAIQYISQNPVNENELVFTTFEKDIYLSEDKGVSWLKIADKGICLDKGD